MKKLSILFAALLMCLVTSRAMAASYTIEFLTSSSDGSTKIADGTTVTDVVTSASAQYIAGFSSNCSNAYLKCKKGVKLGTGSKTGTLEFTLASSAQANIKKITVKSAQYSSDTGTLSLVANDNTLLNAFTPGKDTTYTFDSKTNVTKLKLVTSTKRAYVSSIILITETPATGITLDPTTLSLEKGATAQLTATLAPTDATTEVVWASSNEAAATVDNGKVTAVGEGTAIITATAGEGVSATCNVTVTAATPVESVTLDQTTLNIEATKSATLVATVLPANATNKNVTWTTSDATVATVKDGVVTGVAAGTADITATTEDGAKIAVCHVVVSKLNGMDYSVNLGTDAGYNTWTVSNKSIGSLSSVWTLTSGYAKATAYNNGNNAAEAWLVSPVLDLSAAEVATMTINHALNYLNGKECPLKIMGTNDGENWVELSISEWPAGSSWTFEDATVDLTSVISANTQVALAYISTTSVTPTWEVKTVTIKGTEAVHATAINLDKTELTLEQYKRSTLTATLTPTDATDAITWETDKADVVTVSATGEIVAVGVGNANITAKVTPAEGTVYTATCAVTITAATPITAAQAAEIAAKLTANNEIAAGGQYVIRGYVTALQGTPSSDMSSYGNYSVWMADAVDGGQVFEAYRVKPIDGKTIAAVGDYVEVIGDITKYGTTYETTQGGSIEVLSMQGDYTIGATDCDYASLYDAFQDYNTKAANGLVLGNVTFKVASDLAEAKNVGLQNPTEYTVTLTVDAAEARTISFSQAADNAGPSGNICIGCDNTLTHTSASVASKNIIIDGAYNGGSTKCLTIKSVKGCQKINGPILIYGNVQDVTVKNCNLIAENGAGSSLYPVTIRSQKNTDYAPKNIVIDNNNIQALNGVSDQGIYFQLTTSGKTKPANVTISNNTIEATTRGIFMNGINGATIKNNFISVRQTSTGMLSYGIWGMNNTEGEFYIEGNFIQELTTAATTSASEECGIVAIQACLGKWFIRNNYVAGFNTTAAADGITLIGIQGNLYADTIVIEHNTIALADQACAISNPTLTKVCMLAPKSAKASVKNNLVYSAEKDFNNALVVPAGTMENNVYCTASYVSDANQAFADYQTASEPTAKSVVSVVFSDLANGDLDLTGTSDGDINLGVVRLEDVTTDIYGTDRDAYTYAGAYQGKEIKDPTTSVEDINANAVEVKKIVRDGQVLIIRDGKTYNMMGQVVE